MQSLTRVVVPMALAAALLSPAVRAKEARVHHVLLISVDGLHQRDLARFIADHPASALSRLSRSGVTWDDARATTPSDSFPGLLALVTGGTPKSTGVYYDDSYDRTLYPPGSNCQGAAGSEIVYDESDDFDMDRLFSGGINPKNLPLQKDASGCHPLYPHSFLRVNTIFEVAKAAGLRTAWSDKHPSYDLVNGPSGNGVDDLYTPEINSLIVNGGVVNGVDLTATQARCDGTNSLPVGNVSVYTDCIPAQEAYDDVKVEAIINLINGKHSDGSRWARDGRGESEENDQGAPAIFGMNFQAVSVGQKLPVGGYADAEGTPSANLADALAHTDHSIGRFVEALERRHLLGSTAIVVSAKHGQSPMDFSKLAMEGGGHAPVQSVRDPIDFVNNADPNVDSVVFTNNDTTGPTKGHAYATAGHLQTDDVGLLWLQDQSEKNRSAVVAQLRGNSRALFADKLPDDVLFSENIVSGRAIAAIFGDGPLAADRAPDVFIQPNAGVIYSGSKKKIAEHGGGAPDDTHVALLISVAGVEERHVAAPVETTQVAPTILRALGLDPRELQAVREEHTKLLTGAPF